MLQTLKDAGSTAKEWMGTGAMILAAAGAIGFSVSPPWPAKADVDTVQSQIKVLLEQQARTDRLSLTTQRLVLQTQLVEAEKDLRKNPDSYSAQQLVSQLKTQIAEIDRALVGSQHP